MYHIDELVMYGGTGVCRVADIGHPDFVPDEDRLYYFLDPVYQNGIIYAPTDNDRVFMRPVLSAEEVQALIEEIPGLAVVSYRGGSMQQLSQRYQNVLDTHSCIDMLQMAKSIYIKMLDALSHNKKLGQIDKRFMKRAEDLLYGEFAVALNKSRDDVEEYVHRKMTENLS